MYPPICSCFTPFSLLFDVLMQYQGDEFLSLSFLFLFIVPNTDSGIHISFFCDKLWVHSFHCSSFELLNSLYSYCICVFVLYFLLNTVYNRLLYIRTILTLIGYAESVQYSSISFSKYLNDLMLECFDWIVSSVR